MLFVNLLSMADALSVISLEQAKEFLVVDFDDRDAEITRHIKSAIGYIEKYTNVMMYNRAVEYVLTGCLLEIYDAPISFVTTGLKTHQNVLSVTVHGKVNDVVDATIGFTDITDVPQDLIEAAYKLITYLFENKDIYTAGLPWDIQMLVNKWRRSATI